MSQVWLYIFQSFGGVSHRHCAVGDFAFIVAIAATGGEYCSPKYLCLVSDGIAVSYVR